MKWILSLIIAGLVSWFASEVFAHGFDDGRGPFGAGNPAIYYAPATLAGREPAFDGSLADWAWYPKNYTYTMENVPRKSDRIKSGEVGRDDFDVLIYGPGWIPSMNMWTFAVQTVDDIFYNPASTPEDPGASWQEDNMQWCTDPDHSGGNFRGDTDSQQAQQNAFTPNVDKLFLHGDRRVWWEFEEPYALKGFKIDRTTGSYTMEVGIKMWDHLDPGGEAASVPHQFAGGQTIGSTFYVRDSDTADDAVSVGWHFADPWENADNFVDFILLSEEETRAEVGPTAVEQTSWGRIKSTFNK